MVVTLSGAAVMVMLTFAVAVLAVGVCASVTVTVKFVAPVKLPVGVPEITPVALFKVSPAGKVPVVMAQL